MRLIIFSALFCVLLQFYGCVATKLVTLPMRIAGEVVGFVPVVGDLAEVAIDTTANTVDLVPL